MESKTYNKLVNKTKRKRNRHSDIENIEYSAYQWGEACGGKIQKWGKKRGYY